MKEARILTVLTDKPKQRKVRNLFTREITLHGRRNPFIAQEGVPILIAVFVLGILVVRFGDPLFAVIPALLLVVLFMVFRDPHRAIPSVALGVFSPVDGEILSVDSIAEGATGAAMLQIEIAVDSMGTYTARSPVEGIIKDSGAKALWVQTDEGQDVVLSFSGYRLGLAPKAFAQFGERLGQGQRCAYLRLTRRAEIQIPAGGKVIVEPGQIIKAGIDVIGNLPGAR